MQKRIFIIISLFLLICVSLFFIPKTREYFLLWKFDITHTNDRIKSKEEIEEILSSFPVISYRELDNEYLNLSKSNTTKYKPILKNSKYYLVKQQDFFRKIAGDFRIKDFVCHDSFYRKCLYNTDKNYYWLIDKNLLFAVIELQHQLIQMSYNPDGFYIRSGHRHPLKNESVKGATLSRHMKGQAIDMVIKDINQDGIYTPEDKEIILQLVDKKIIAHKGGVGRYPGTRTVHIDVRGKRARWDSY